MHGTHLDSSAELKPLRLEHVMYMSFCNDVSCLIDNKIIVLAEHQSTVNANMPSQTLYVVYRVCGEFLRCKNIAFNVFNRHPWRL